MFVHFLNDQILRLYRPRTVNELTYAQIATLNLRCIWLLESAPALVPTVDLVQSPVVPHLTPMLRIACEYDLVRFVGSTRDVDELIIRKQRHFADTRQHRVWFDASTDRLIRPFEPVLDVRTQNTTVAMRRAWAEAAAHRSETHSRSGFLPSQLAQLVVMSTGRRATVAGRDITSLADRLGSRAFLGSVVRDLGLLKRNRWPDHAHQQLEYALAYAWLRTHVDEYGPKYVATVTTGWPFDCGLRFDRDAEPQRLDCWLRTLDAFGLATPVCAAPDEALMSLVRSVDYELLRSRFLLPVYRALQESQHASDLAALAALSAARREPTWRREDASLTRAIGHRLAILDRCAAPNDSQRNKESGMSPGTLRVFIGHGRSDQWRALKDYVSDDLGCDWEEFTRSPTAGRTAKERLEELLDACNVALLVLTAEDERADGHLMARQNVIHETGLFQGRLGFARAIVVREEGCARVFQSCRSPGAAIPSGKD